MTLQHDGIDLEDVWQAIEVCYEKSWTDGLPVVPPTEPLVARMLAAAPWAEDDVLLFEPARNLTVTAYKAAVTAVMARWLRRTRAHRSREPRTPRPRAPGRSKLPRGGVCYARRVNTSSKGTANSQAVICAASRPPIFR